MDMTVNLLRERDRINQLLKNITEKAEKDKKQLALKKQKPILKTILKPIKKYAHAKIENGIIHLS